eukprot:CAMPEP_0183449316 /NCGR_PEP_ID=MMETSP0370-20130417/109232_1 /TAXON_ID=268820 /ORGANISM="Peridinium aciculiferum, Strain PAER-2" /LENGTH=65 /DNA_ID=CAMNT_0025640389 /DNA_START=59 /DNA_END=256 /DNA_ORIENTATION=-
MPFVDCVLHLTLIEQGLPCATKLLSAIHMGHIAHLALIDRGRLGMTNLLLLAALLAIRNMMLAAE